MEFASEEGKAMASNSVASATPTGGWDNHPGNDVDDGQPQWPENEIINEVNIFYLLLNPRVCHEFEEMKRDDFFRITFDYF